MEPNTSTILGDHIRSLAERFGLSPMDELAEALDDLALVVEDLQRHAYRLEFLADEPETVTGR